MPPIHGSCLCGGVEFEIAGPLMAPLNCHCSQCRKQHGAAFRSRVRVQAKDFRWLHGEHLVKFYESSRGYQRGFCSECGSPIINRNGPNWKPPAEFPNNPSPQYGVALALLDDPPAAAGAALLRRQQGAVVRDHRRPAAISGISAGLVDPPLPGGGCRPTGPARSGRPDGRLRRSGGEVPNRHFPSRHPLPHLPRFARLASPWQGRLWMVSLFY